MRSYRIVALPGDGIGKEIMPLALDVLNSLQTTLGSFDLVIDQYPWGCEHYLETGLVMPADGIQILSQYDAIYFVAAGHPDVDDTLSGWEFIYQMRKQFKEYVCQRPIQSYEGIETRITNKAPIDLIVIRENSEGEYAGMGGIAHKGFRNEVAIQTTVMTREGVERIARYAFELARTRRNHVTSVTKSNALQYSQTFWDRIVAEVSSEYPDVEFDWLYADAATMRFVQNPAFFDVIVTTNLFGDLLSDLGGAIVGSIGLMASANINPEGDFPSMYEPVHGSAPDIAGKGIANPLAMILAGAMMLDGLGESVAGDILRRSVASTIQDGVLTRDLGGSAHSSDVAASVQENIQLHVASMK
ncbi:MAG: tartrate dehydrogenase [Anaerolineaceae bacterium]|nr:tartrate dehydrogenase [Anaerolineaceae bacterium]